MTEKKRGRPKGSKNKKTLLLESIGGKSGESQLWAQVCEQAKGGAEWAVKMVAERVYSSTSNSR